MYDLSRQVISHGSGLETGFTVIYKHGSWRQDTTSGIIGIILLYAVFLLLVSIRYMYI